MVMRTDSATSPPQGAQMKSKPAPAPAQNVAHHHAMGHAAFAGMRHLATGGGQQAVVPAEQFFQAQEDFVTGVPYAGLPTPPGTGRKGR